MSRLQQYIGKDVVYHFAGLIKDISVQKITIIVTGDDLMKTIRDFGLDVLIGEKITLIPITSLTPDSLLDGFNRKIHSFAKSDKAIVTVREKEWDCKVENVALSQLVSEGYDIRQVKNILDAMIVASKKRRNRVLYPVSGFEDEALLTAAGLAKAKTVGFRNFFVLPYHFNTPAWIKYFAAQTKAAGFIVPLKTGLNTGMEMYAETPLVHRKSVVISGYEPEEIMQSVYMVTKQFAGQRPQVSFQHTKEVSERAQWMIEEVFDAVDLTLFDNVVIRQGRLGIKEKYKMFALPHDI